MNTNAAAGIETRVLTEGYGAGAWHGPDLKAALADVTPGLAVWRPAPGRHNIAEIALHHAYYTRVVRSKVAGRPADPAGLPDEEWVAVDDEKRLSWAEIRSTVESEQQRLAELLAAVEADRTASPLPAPERFNLVLGITCHAVYHAGQVQLIKRLRER